MKSKCGLKPGYGWLIAVAAFFLVDTSAAASTTLFDNGSYSGSQRNLRNIAGTTYYPQRVFDDFVLLNDAKITGFEWRQHDRNTLQYVSTEISIYNGLPIAANLVFKADVVAVRTPNTTGTLFEWWEGYDYAVSGLSIRLPAGKYLLGLNTNSTRGDTSWDTTNGSTMTIPGRYLVNINFPEPGEFIAFEDSVFRIIGEEIIGPTGFGGVDFPAGPVSFADKVVQYDPGYGGGPEPDVTQQDARQILGVPKQGSMSLGNGGQIIVRFMDNKLVPSGDSRPDLFVFEVGEAESTRVEIKGNRGPWYPVGTARGHASGIDIDAYGFGRGDSFMFVRLTDDGDSYNDDFTPGADLVAVGARTTIRSRRQEEYLTYWIQAHVGGRSQLIIRENTLSWHHFKGTAPGQTRASSGFPSGSNSPTIIDSNQGPNIEWVHNDWPERLSNGTHPEAWAHFDLLTPVFPKEGWCWKVEQLSGVVPVNVNAQPSSANGYALKLMFNDLGSGNNEHLSGSGFYSIQLTNRPC